MGRFILRRLLGLIPTLLIIVTVCFFIIRLAPGGPFSAERKVPVEVLRNLEAKYNLDKPIMEQYVLYLWDIVRGDFGPSMAYKDFDVSFYIKRGLPVSALLGVSALLLALICGGSVGMVSALQQNKWPDYLFMSIAVLGISVPAFIVGPLYQWIFSMNLDWFPVAGWINDKGFAAFVLPVATLSLVYFATIARLSRASFLEELRSDYVRTARAKGLKTNVIMFKHVLKGAALPIVSYLGPALASIVTGSIVVEQIFKIPGMGRHFVQSAFNRDYTMIMGTVIVYSVLLMVMNFVVDILYGFLDPRVSYK